MQPGGGPTVGDRIVAELRDRIKQGELVGGQRLVEADWTRELGVSRGPLREALGRLASEGLVVVEPNRGAVVRRLRAKDIVDLYEARAAIEGQAAVLAARCIGHGDHKRALREQLGENEPFLRGGELARYMPINERFHHLILDLADNEILSRLGMQLQVLAYHLQTTRVVRATWPEPMLSVTGSARFHHDIGNAILRGDEDQADQLMRAHLIQTRDGILAVDRRKEAAANIA